MLLSLGVGFLCSSFSLILSALSPAWAIDLSHPKYHLQMRTNAAGQEDRKEGIESVKVAGEHLELIGTFFKVMDRTQRFPRNYRGTLNQWVEDQLWGILDLLIEAAYTRHKLPLLEQSNLHLQKRRFLTRICKDRQCLSLDPYEYAARMINEIGTELGGWIKQQHARQV
jgi:hypothetical protein